MQSVNSTRKDSDVSKDLSLPGPDVPVIDETRLLEEFGGDQEILNELRDLFLEHVPPLFEDIVQAAINGDAEAVASNVHSLKGACATYGAPRLAMVCKEMELWARAGEMDSVKANMDQLNQEYEQVYHQIKEMGVAV
jgi:HPt (histidine-containing phosphotransfer) domain-containing protein